ncbi:MAG: hypothetical protein ABRQ39_18885 [Candidatus Eremiobacterota bacterium]
MEEPYELVLKTYQLKEIFLSARISLTVHDCEKLLKAGFCQSISRLTRKHLNILTENKQINLILLGLTHKCLLSDPFRRRFPLIEKITFNDLLSIASTALYIIEYITSILYLSEKIDNINHRYREQIKKELSLLTVPGPVESLMIIETFLNEELCKELKFLSGRAFIKEPLSSRAYHLLKLIDTKIAYVPEDLKPVEHVIETFIKASDKPDILLHDLRHNELNIIKSLKHMVVPLLDILEEDNLEEYDRVTLFLFNSFYMALHLLFISLEEIDIFLHDGNLYDLITAIQLLSISISCLTLMIDRRPVLFNDKIRGAEKFIDYFTGKCDKKDVIQLIEEEMNNLYMKQELEDHITYEPVIRDYKKSLELLGEETPRSLSVFLKGQNRLLTTVKSA